MSKVVAQLKTQQIKSTFKNNKVKAVLKTKNTVNAVLED